MSTQKVGGFFPICCLDVLKRYARGGLISLSLSALNYANRFPRRFFLPAGLLSAAEEQTLIQHIRTIDFGEVKMRGMVARRRVAHFGWLYNYESWQIEPGAVVPEFLSDVRERAAALVQVEAPQLAQVLVTG